MARFRSFAFDGLLSRFAVDFPIFMSLWCLGGIRPSAPHEALGAAQIVLVSLCLPTMGYAMPDVPIGGPDCTYQPLPIDTTIAQKGTYFQVPIFTEWLPYLGQIVFLWGSFEVKCDRLLEAMFAAAGMVPEPRWKKRKGKRRHQIFLDQADRTFAPGTTINTYLHELVRDSIALQNRRNLLLHGEVSLVMGPDPHMVVEGLSADGQPERHQYREIDIKRLFYELSHLVGRFTPLFQPGTATASEQLPSADISTLQAFWQKAQTSSPTPKTP